MNLYDETSSAEDPDFVGGGGGLRNLSASPSFVNYTMLDFDGGEASNDSDEQLYRDSLHWLHWQTHVMKGKNDQ